jgi:hypothetical protein
MPEQRMKMHAERAAATMHQRMHEAKEWVMGVVQPFIQRMTWHKEDRPEQHPDISQAERDAARQHATGRAQAPAQARAQQQSHGQDLEL